MRSTATLAALAAFLMLPAGAPFAQPTKAAAASLPPSGAADVRASQLPMTVLYEQTDIAPTVGAMAMNFLDAGFDIYDSEAADDFTVPAGQVWLVQAVDVHYSWVAGLVAGPQATDLAMNVTFHRGARPGGLPGVPIARFYDIPVDVLNSNTGYVAIALPSTVRLRPGTYWVSVQLNVAYLDIFGYWLWSGRSSQTGAPAAWRNPGGGWDASCTRWSHSANCLYGTSPGDHVFTLRGTVQ